MKVFVSHYPALESRRQWLEPALRELGMEAEWITHFDRRTVSPQLMTVFYHPNPELFRERADLGGAHKSPLKFAPLKSAEILNAMTHLYIFQQIVEQDLPQALILEDDIVFKPTFREELAHYMVQLPDDWDVFYPGSGCDLHLPRTSSDVNVYRNTEHQSRTADCYLIRQRAAQKLLSTMIPFVLPFDWELNYHQREHALNIYWGEPSIAFQGSETGVYESSAKV